MKLSFIKAIRVITLFIVGHKLSSTFLIGSILLLSTAFGQAKSQKGSSKSSVVSTQDITLHIVDGSFSQKLSDYKIPAVVAENNMEGWLKLPEGHKLIKSHEKNDELGFTHTTYYQYFKNYFIDGKIVILHSKEGITTSINGQIAQFTNIPLTVTFPQEKAEQAAMNYLRVEKLIQKYPVATIIARLPGKTQNRYQLVHKVRIDSYSPLVMKNVMIEVVSGDVVNSISLIHQGDIEGKGKTLYSGEQSLICDSFQGKYRLRDGSRRIETYDATDGNEIGLEGYEGKKDFYNESSNWTEQNIWYALSIEYMDDNWWNDDIGDFLMLHILVKNSLGETVSQQGPFFTDLGLPFNLNFNLNISEGPYKVYFIDEDWDTTNDTVGSFTVKDEGVISWQFKGNSGTYSTGLKANPAIDVHWGMEKTLDFFKLDMNQNSYDNAGGIIRQFINPPSVTNNAFAYPPPYNFMAYGLGDGQYMNPVVGIDVAGHEFTHLVVANNTNGGLTYQGESGALNESFADIFGTCVEFYADSSIADWLIGEDVMVQEPFIRSMKNPNEGDQPDTYEGTYWIDVTDLSFDNGGVHFNSGVQNFWFYLLCNGGSGINDNLDSYNVKAIAMADASKIAYRNFWYFMGADATYQEAYSGSLQAAEDLFGAASQQYKSVKDAWFAVGIGGNGNIYCKATTRLYPPSGTFTDGSENADYGNFSRCRWVIAPTGATRINIAFPEVDLTDDDYITIYDGPNETYPIIGLITSNQTQTDDFYTTDGVGAMCVKFITNKQGTSSGWKANYNSIVSDITCNGSLILSSAADTITDGVEMQNYATNQSCTWLISPPCASEVTLEFLDFSVNDGDKIIVYDDEDKTNILGTYTGFMLPPSITSLTGKMVVTFVTDCFMEGGLGFVASYSSNGGGCIGFTDVETNVAGAISDGSAAGDYCKDANCSWLIHSPEGNPVQLKFKTFDLQEKSSPTFFPDGVEVYDGSTSFAPLLGRFAGNTLPPVLESSGEFLLVKFYTDSEINKSGWSADYSFITLEPVVPCEGNKILTEVSGTIEDGSTIANYPDNTTCTWLIQPVNAGAITFSFLDFKTQKNFDFVNVYNGIDNTAPLLGSFTGPKLPPDVLKSGSSMFVEFISDSAVTAAGWKAKYTTSLVSINENSFKSSTSISPNPTNGKFNIFTTLNNMSVEIYNVLGQKLTETLNLQTGDNALDLAHLNSGVFLLKFKVGDTIFVERLVIQ